MTSFAITSEFVHLAVCVSGPIVALALLFFIRGGLRWKTLQNLRGPSRGSWLFGHQAQFYSQRNVGDLDFQWAAQYGGAWKIDGCFGRNILMLSDPGAIRHIIHNMGYGYQKTRELKTFFDLAVGKGITSAEVKAHELHRKLLGHAFTAQAQRHYYPIFRRSAAQLRGKWSDNLQEGDCSKFQTIDVRPGLVDTALDIIGEAGFDFHFGSLDDGKEEKELSKTFHNLFANSSLSPSKIAILFSASWAYWPQIALRYVGILPFRQFRLFKEFVAAGQSLGRVLIKNQTAVDGKKQRDILSIIVAANKANSKTHRLSEEEILAQITTLLVAGHETSATTLSWLLYALACHPEDQVRVREEIKAKRSKIAAEGRRDFTSSDLEGLTFTNAVIKEVLRMYPIGPWLLREALVNDIVPLSEPVIGVDGQPVSEIKIIPGQHVFVSVCAYNRHPGTWGSDSHEWRPSRHLDPNGGMKEKRISIGLYSNLLTFSGGHTSCMGWKFALTEMLVIVAELIEHFEFCTPPGGIKMLCAPVGPAVTPVVEGKLTDGPQMPLGVRPL